MKALPAEDFRILANLPGVLPLLRFAKNIGGLLLERRRFSSCHFSHTPSPSINRSDDAPVPHIDKGLTHFCWVRTCATFEERTQLMQLPIPTQTLK
jgi:hypothetical protein